MTNKAQLPDIETLRELKRAGLSYWEIATQYGVTNTTIRKIFLANLPDLETLRELKKKGLADEEIADNYGVTHTTIRTILESVTSDE